MNDSQLKALATQVAVIKQALAVGAAVSEDLRMALQPSINQAAILFTDAIIAATTHAEAQGLPHAEALQVALSTLASVQAAVMSGVAQATKPNE
jgi:pyrimidine deaminase RibD-like protein